MFWPVRIRYSVLKTWSTKTEATRPAGAPLPGYFFALVLGRSSLPLVVCHRAILISRQYRRRP